MADENIDPVAPEQEVEQEEQFQTFKTFDERHRQPFEGLAYIGALTDTVRIPNHEFVIRTLTVGEKLQVGLLTKEFEGTLGYARAYKAAIVAASLDLVDGRPLLVAERNASVIHQKFDYVVNTWYDPIIFLLYERQDALEQVVVEVAKELGLVGGKRKIAQPDTVDDSNESSGT